MGLQSKVHWANVVIMLYFPATGLLLLRYYELTAFKCWPSALIRVFGGLCHDAKFGWHRRSSFDNMPVLMFCELGLPLHASFGWFLGDLNP